MIPARMLQLTLPMLMALPAVAGRSRRRPLPSRSGASAPPPATRNIVAAKSRVLSRKLGSSCGFMSGYSSNDDDVMLRYMNDFSLEGSSSNLAEHFNEFSPNGDVSNSVDP